MRFIRTSVISSMIMLMAFPLELLFDLLLGLLPLFPGVLPALAGPTVNRFLSICRGLWKINAGGGQLSWRLSRKVSTPVGLVWMPMMVPSLFLLYGTYSEAVGLCHPLLWWIGNSLMGCSYIMASMFSSSGSFLTDGRSGWSYSIGWETVDFDGYSAGLVASGDDQAVCSPF